MVEFHSCRKGISRESRVCIVTVTCTRETMHADTSLVPLCILRINLAMFRGNSMHEHRQKTPYHVALWQRPVRCENVEDNCPRKTHSYTYLLHYVVRVNSESF